MAIQQVFSNNLIPAQSNLSSRFTQAKAFYLDAPLTQYELEIDVFLQVYLPTSNGETVRNLPLGNLTTADTETLITIPNELGESNLEMALAFYSSDTTYLEVFVLRQAVTSHLLNRKINQLTQSINDMALFFQDSVNQSNSTAATMVSVTVNTTTTPVLLLAANSNRKRFSLRNKGSKDCVIGFITTFAPADNYITLAKGAVYESDIAYTGAVYALSAAANNSTDILVTEFV